MATEQLLEPVSTYHGATKATLEYCYLETPTSPHVTVSIRFYDATQTAQGAARVQLPLALAGEYIAKGGTGQEQEYVVENITMLQNALKQLNLDIEFV